MLSTQFEKVRAQITIAGVTTFVDQSNRSRGVEPPRAQRPPTGAGSQVSNPARSVPWAVGDPRPHHGFDLVWSRAGVRPSELLAHHFQSLEVHLIDHFERELHAQIPLAGPLPEMRKTAPKGGFWSGRRDSNPRPSPWQGDALPTEPRPRRGVKDSPESRGCHLVAHGVWAGKLRGAAPCGGGIPRGTAPGSA